MCSICYSCQILMELEFSRQIFEKKKCQISDFIQTRQVGAELFHSDRLTGRRTDKTKLIMVFPTLANAPKTVFVI
jgi:hypothetical protein